MPHDYGGGVPVDIPTALTLIVAVVVPAVVLYMAFDVVEADVALCHSSLDACHLSEYLHVRKYLGIRGTEMKRGTFLDVVNAEDEVHSCPHLYETVRQRACRKG